LQLESATRKGDKLLTDIDILTENWDRLNEELVSKQQEVRGIKSVSCSFHSTLFNLRLSIKHQILQHIFLGLESSKPKNSERWKRERKCY
jgi:hypothetical protein